MTYNSIEDRLIPGMMEIYKNTIKTTGNEPEALRKTREWLRENDCKCSDRTIRRQINKQLGGAYKANSISSYKIDPSREDEVQLMHAKIEHILDVLLDRYHDGVKEKKPDSSLIALADAISRQRELQIKLLSLSPKKNQQSIAIDNKEAGKIVFAQQIDS